MANKKRATNKSTTREELNVWQPSSDLMTGLVLVLLLVILALVLYIMQIPDTEYTNFNDDNYSHDDGDGGHGYKEGDDYADDDNHSDYDGTVGTAGGGGDGGGTDEGDYPSDGMKSAVYVTLIDADTKKAIKEKGVTFELYSGKNALQILNTYYPNKKAYKEYETTKDGTFYLPEKIFESQYYLHQTSDVKGYDPVDRVEFDLNDVYDWSDPFVVKVPLYPSSDIIRVQMMDKKDGTSISGGEFEVFAAEDIITEDGTVRYKKGDSVGKIVCDDKGYGESDRLFLGKYTVKQSAIPQYYASYGESIEKTLTSEKDDEPQVTEIASERTKITFVLVDELTNNPIAGVQFAIDGNMYTTDENGRIELAEVEKDKTYEFLQVDTIGDYREMENPIKVTISKNGRVDGESEVEVTGTNRLLRVEVSTKDALIGGYISEVPLELFNESGQKITSWTSNGAYQEFTDLTEGKYYVVVSGKSDKKYPITVTDTAQEQKTDIRLFTARSYIAIIGGTLMAVGLVLIGIKIARVIRGRNSVKSE